MYVAQRGDKEREAVVREVSAPVDGVRTKLEEVEKTLAGFQRTMHLVLGEVDADRERLMAIEVSEDGPIEEGFHSQLASLLWLHFLCSMLQAYFKLPMVQPAGQEHSATA